MKLPQIYDAISLYEYVISVGIFIFAVASNNLFLFVLLAGALSTDIPVTISKQSITNPRPKGAMNCDILNQGGDRSKDNGFPSGHTTFSTFLFVYSLYEYNKIQKESGKSLWGILLVTGVFFVLMPIARIRKQCHTPIQVIGGIVLGTFWAVVFILLENMYFVDIPQYQQDKKRFIRSLMS